MRPQGETAYLSGFFKYPSSQQLACRPEPDDNTRGFIAKGFQNAHCRAQLASPRDTFSPEDCRSYSRHLRGPESAWCGVRHARSLLSDHAAADPAVYKLARPGGACGQDL